MLTLKPDTQKNLNDIPAVAHAGEAMAGTSAVASAASAAPRHTPKRAVAGPPPRLIRRVPERPLARAQVQIDGLARARNAARFRRAQHRPASDQSAEPRSEPSSDSCARPHPDREGNGAVQADTVDQQSREWRGQ